jgi:hypothetical protein
MKDVEEVITTFRELQGLDCVDVDRACGFSEGSLSRFEKRRPKSLAEDRIAQVLEYLHIMENEGKVRFIDGSFVKVRLSEGALGLINYSRLYFVLDMYKNERIRGFVHRSTKINIVDRLGRKMYPVPPSDALFVRIENLLFFVKRKWGYLLEMRDLMTSLEREYRNIEISEIESDAALDFESLTREGAERIIREARVVVSGGRRNR